MRLTERVLTEQRRNKLREDEQTQRQQDQDEDETGMAYEKRPKRTSLDRYRGVFVNKDLDGINTRPDIFERTAVFHTSSSE